MEVLFLEDVKGKGQKMEVKKMPLGYAKNFLIPRKLAVPATKDALARKGEWERQKGETAENIEAQKEKLEKDSFVFRLKTGEKGEVFSSVTEADIKKALEEKGYKDFSVTLPRSIRDRGEYTIEIRFAGGVSANAKFTVEAV